MKNLLNESVQKNRTICLPIEETSYKKIVQDSRLFRSCLDKFIAMHPELFPQQIQKGYLMKDLRISKKSGIPIRRIEIENISYSIRPSFLMPHMTGFTDEVEAVLFLRKFNVPFWALAKVFHHDPMYWYRMTCGLGRNSLVGTTVHKAQNLPQDLVADEKHSHHLGQKIYVATTAAKNCIMGVSITKNCDEESLEKAYGVFKKEALILNPGYSPTTVNTDGWPATQNAWKKLFPGVVLILCIMHLYISIRDRLRKKADSILKVIADYFWDCYQAENKSQFAQRIRRFCEWAKQNTFIPEAVKEKIQKLHDKRSLYALAYDYPQAHRTSAMLDRAMQRMDRHLFNTQYFHGKESSADLSTRAWALIYNFAPFNPYTQKQSDFHSYVEQLNQSRYHKCWLHNLLIAASLGGFRTPPQNPL